MIHAYTGDGKGKTTAAVGLAIRAFGAGKKVCVIFFDKGSITYKHNELTVFDRLEIEYHLTGMERMKTDGTFRFGVIEEDRAEAEKALKLARKCLKNKEADMLVLDEALTSYTVSLIKKEDLMQIIAETPEEIELVLTGRCTDPEILEQADLVTSMNKQKHYFDKGIQARSGIEY
ncbi:MAG: cob(I)yrinic acid a,c-diamide adenosyltransferase [Candidatus Rifleibacteriota bacterium]